MRVIVLSAEKGVSIKMIDLLRAIHGGYAGISTIRPNNDPGIVKTFPASNPLRIHVAARIIA